MPRAKKILDIDDPQLLNAAYRERKALQDHRRPRQDGARETPYVSGLMSSLVLTNGTGIPRIADPCYGYMKRDELFSYYKKSKLKLAYFVHWPISYRVRGTVQGTRYPVGPMTAEEKTYLQWFLNDSPWADGFVTKDPEDVFMKGAISRTDFPAAYIVAGGMGIRYCMYATGVIDGFTKLKDLIPNPMERFLFSHAFRINKTGGVENNAEFSHSYLVYSEEYMFPHVFSAMLNNNRDAFSKFKMLRDWETNYYPTSKAWVGPGEKSEVFLPSGRPKLISRNPSLVSMKPIKTKDAWGMTVVTNTSYPEDQLPTLINAYLEQFRDVKND